jgi:hypothetical protein
MGPIRSVFLDAAVVARDLIATREVEKAWSESSALAEMSVGLLCGHLARVVGSPIEYLAAPEPDDGPVDAAEYYVRILPSADLEHPVNVGVRNRSGAYAEGGQPATVARIDDWISKGRSTYEAEPATRKVKVFGEVVMALDDYLVTRIIELVIHVDDLAASLGTDTPPMPRAAMHIAIENMLSIGRRRHGDMAVVRALSRRERDDVSALRVF